jgi:glutamate synthase (NADPH) large chain
MINKLNETEKGLYREAYEFDSCGVGYICDIKGKKTHQTVSDALTILENMEHRGACGCDPNSGDGAGLLMQIPHNFLVEECNKIDIKLPKPGQYGMGMLFLPKKPTIKEVCRKAIQAAADKTGLKIIGYRKVPVDPSMIGETALSMEPDMEQIFIARPENLTNDDDFERKLFVLKARMTKYVREKEALAIPHFYVVTLSSRITVYKGQFTSHQVRQYFPDLRDKHLTSAFGMVHSRFSTNTSPSWRLAQPFRFMAHNGEINTIVGNTNWFYSGMRSFVSPYFTKEEMDDLLPVIDYNQSDSACLDNVVELLVHAGRSLPHVMMMLVPEAWDGNEQMDPLKKAFYEYHATLMEPWDGPAALTFTDGKIIGATLDRNGLRPLRYVITSDNRIIVASEAGVLPIDEKTVIKKGRLQPGKMLIVNIEEGRVISDEEVKGKVASAQPYGDWLTNFKIILEDLDDPKVVFTELSGPSTFKYQQVFGYTREDLETIIKPMALDGKEAIGSMGTDTPLAILSDKPQHLSNYFKQHFAQVTNPPIDPIREKLVMSLVAAMGNNGNLLSEDKMHCHSLFLKQPILTNYDLEKIRSIDSGSFQAKTLQTYFNANGQPGSLEKGLERLCRYAEDAISDGFELLILSDRKIDSQHAPIPSLLAVSAVHHHLIKKGLRGAVGIIVEAGDVWEVHHFACLVSFGATAVNPYLAFASINKMVSEGTIETKLELKYLVKNYVKSVSEGLLKVFSKMGISTLQSYHGAQVF